MPPLARIDPGALVAILSSTGGICPPSRGVLVGDSLGVLVAVDDAKTVQRTSQATVHVVLAAARANIHYIGHVGECDVSAAPPP